MSEENTQIFRGDEPPQMAVAETARITRKRAPDGPVDQRGLHDQKDGASFDRALHDASGGPEDRRHIDDADGLSELRQLHGQDGRGGATALQDAEGPSTLNQLHDAGGAPGDAALRGGEGPSDQRAIEDADGLSEQRQIADGGGPADERRMEDGDGPVDQRRMDNGDGPADQRSMKDAEGLAEQRQMQDAQGLSDLRQMRDQQAPLPRDVVSDFSPDKAGEATDNAAAAAELVQAVAPEVMSDPDLTFKAEDNATPWALSIHLEERIASLGLSTAKVKQQLDKLDESVERLGKRIAK